MPGNDSTKSSLNLGSAKFSSVIGNVKNAVADINNMMLTSLQRSSSIVANLQRGVQQLNQGMQTGYGPTSASSPNLLFSQPIPTAAGSASQLPGMGGMGGAIGNNLYQHRYSYGMAAAGAVLSSMPSPNDQVNLNYLTNRSLFYGLGGFDTKNFGGSPNTPGFLPFAKNTREEQYNRVSGVQREFSKLGTTTGSMDAVKAMMAGQANGINMALPGYQNLLKGVADMSNLTPGVGLEGSMQSYASLQQAPRVNMLRVAGIQARDPITGQPKSFRDIAEQVWQKLQREKIGGSPITKEDIAQGLLPGNSLDQMMKNLFGGDQFLASQVTAALYAKASGAKNFSKAEMERVAGTTNALNSQSNRFTKGLETLQQSARGGAGGYTASNEIASVLASLTNTLDRLTGVLSGGSFANAFGLGMGGMGNGIISKGVGGVMGILKSLGIPGFASGGDMSGDGKTPYVVGERGPELFVPRVDGTIIPNHMMPPGITRAKGGGVSAGGSNSPLSNPELRDILSKAGFSGASLETAMKVVRQESGGIPSRLNPDASTGDYSMGLFQVNMIGQLGKDRNAKYLNTYKNIGYKGPESLYDPAINAAIAYDISKGGTKWTDAWKNTSKKLGISGGVASNEPSPYPSPTGSDTSLKSLLQSSAGGANVLNAMQGGSTGNVTNNNLGGVTILVSGAKDKKGVADEIKSTLLKIASSF